MESDNNNQENLNEDQPQQQPQPQAEQEQKFNSLSDIAMPAASQPAATPRKKTSIWKVFFVILFVLSVLGNIILFGTVALVAAFSGTGSNSDFQEESIVNGSKGSKIGVIRIEGVIDAETADTVIRQLDKAGKDPRVKGIIMRTATPGGSVVASDEIHHAIIRYKNTTGKPVIAFMQGLAASGGYYTSVACDKIIAEPTTITGSIGVIMQTFMLEELFKDKLGIESVTMKSGKRKDWPTTFSKVSDEQKEYLMNKLITPAYERFVRLVAKGRDGLNVEQVKALADGSIYHADEALENGLIDQIGYMEDAIDLISDLADVENPYVFEYKEEFHFSSLLGAESKSKSLIQMNESDIRNALTPNLMYLWDGSN